MAACTFLGHRDCPDSIKPKLRDVLIDLIETHHVNVFYVGRQGNFDAIVYNLLTELASAYPAIRYFVVLERVPTISNKSRLPYSSDTILPDGIETVHPRFAISKRNRWMIDQSDYVVSYVVHSWGGAAKFSEVAKKLGKTILNLPAL